MVDQRRFDNQQWIDAATAAARLGVKRRSLYAYVSRGLVRSAPGGRGRARRYAADDVERLRARAQARAGHGAVAAGALRWGEPVLDSAITAIAPGGPIYRGHAALALARAGAGFENVAELLWSGHLPAGTVAWPRGRLRAKRLARLLPERGAPPIAVMALALPAIALDDPGRDDPRPDAVVARARRLLPLLAAACAPGLEQARVAAALAAPTVATALSTALRARGGADAVRAMELAMILLADHELNASSFAARVAASTEADAYACVAAALATLSGGSHGGAPTALRAQLSGVAATGGAGSTHGFGHPLYADGDPRAVPLLEAARALAPRARGVRVALELARHGPAPANVDLGLAALAEALALPAGGEAALFAVARAAGWIAHVLEQRAAGFMLRPRARYVGVAPVAPTR